MGLATHSLGPPPDSPTVSCVLLTDGLTAETAAWFEGVRKIVDEFVVLVDRSRADDYTRETAAALATHLHEVNAKGYVEAHLREMVEACDGDWILRLDSDERLGPAWHDGSWHEYLQGEQTHFWVPRQWYDTPNTYLTVAPWLGDPQMRLFRNVPSEITFPEEIHEPTIVAGPTRHLAELPVEHHVLWLKTRAEREEKVARYLQLRPEKACADFYLFEEQLRGTSSSPSEDRPATMAMAGAC